MNNDFDKEKEECGCGDNCSSDQDCSCGDDCSCNEEEPLTMDLVLEDGTELKCEVIGTFLIEDQMYIALLPIGEEEVFIYKYEEIDDDNIELTTIEDDQEFEEVTEAFFELYIEDNEEYEKEIDELLDI